MTKHRNTTEMSFIFQRICQFPLLPEKPSTKKDKLSRLKGICRYNANLITATIGSRTFV